MPAHHRLAFEFCCIALITDMIVAITTVQLATIAKGLSVVDWLDDFLYLPEVMYIIIFLLLISLDQDGSALIGGSLSALACLMPNDPAKLHRCH